MFSCHKNKDQLPNNENLKRKTQSTGKIKQIKKREHNACFLDNEWVFQKYPNKNKWQNSLSTRFHTQHLKIKAKDWTPF